MNNLIQQFNERIAEVIRSEEASQLRESLDSGEYVRGEFKFDNPAIGYAKAIEVDKIDRELSLLELREEITETERENILKAIM